MQNSTNQSEIELVTFLCKNSNISFDDIELKYNQLISEFENKLNFRSYDFGNLDDIKYHTFQM